MYSKGRFLSTTHVHTKKTQSKQELECFYGLACRLGVCACVNNSLLIFFPSVFFPFQHSAQLAEENRQLKHEIQGLKKDLKETERLLKESEDKLRKVRQLVN